MNQKKKFVQKERSRGNPFRAFPGQYLRKFIFNLGRHNRNDLTLSGKALSVEGEQKEDFYHSCREAAGDIGCRYSSSVLPVPEFAVFPGVARGQKEEAKEFFRHFWFLEVTKTKTSRLGKSLAWSFSMNPMKAVRSISIGCPALS